MQGEASFVINEDDARAVARTRRLIAEHLTAHGLAEIAPDTELVASEFVTNALLHAGPPVRVVLRVTARRVRVEVHDRSPAMPVPVGAAREAMTGRGLRIADALANVWGASRIDGGKSLWAELEIGAGSREQSNGEQLATTWLVGEESAATDESRTTVRLGDVPTDLLLTAKSHVDDLVREFTLAAAGASSGITARVSPALAELIESVVHRFAEARESIRRQALAARARGEDHVTLELRLASSAADAGEEYLRALDEADAHCRAARLLTLETPPQHRVFRRWYVEELVRQLRQLAAGKPAAPSETFEQRLLREIDAKAETERRATRGARLHELSLRLTEATTPEAVAEAALGASVAVLGASGGAVLLEVERWVAVSATVGYDPGVVARLHGEPRSAELPAATALRTGEEVWLESPEERDEAFPELRGLEPDTVSMAAVPLETGDRRLGALRFSFSESRIFDAEERGFVRAIAAQTAQALDRAELSAAQDAIAAGLRRGLLPPALPTVPGLDLSAAYHPLTDSLEVGGDFYDVWPCGEGRYAIAVGDVSGHGLEATATTALVRHTLRALTMTSSDALAILAMLDRALRDALAGTDRFATVALGFLEPGEDECSLDLATGGHPGPILLRRDGGTEVVSLTSSLLGILDQAELDLRHITLRRGDEAVLVTDGVIDTRDDRGGWFGLEGTVAAVAGAGASGTDTAEAISQAALAHGGGRLHDDLVVLALRWNGR